MSARRMWVAVGDAPPRWYRSLAEATEDAEDVAGTPLAVAWDRPDSPAPSRWLVRGPRGALSWLDTPPPTVTTPAVEAMADGAQSRRSPG